MDTQPSPAELQQRMTSLMQQLHGVMSQIQRTAGASGAALPAGLADPSAAFAMPGSVGSASTGASLDQDLARLLPPDVLRGNSPHAMDHEKWMSSMIGAVPMSIGGFDPAYMGGGFRGRGGRGRGGLGPTFFPPPEFVPHGRGPMHPPMFDPTIPPPLNTTVPSSVPEEFTDPAAAFSPPKPRGLQANAASFVPNLMAKPFRPQTHASAPKVVAGAPLPPESDIVLREAFGPYANADADFGVRGVSTRGGRGRKPRMEVEACDSTTPMAYVEFKRQRIKKFPSNSVIQPGQYVIVDGDRGQDCGLLVQMTAPTTDGKGLSVLSMEGSNLDEHKIKVEKGRVLRVAEPHEVDLLHSEIANSERNALKTCRQRCSELGLKIEVLDCEYQFDMKKISFYFNSEESVDFRDLVRELYRTFGARIWMENINPNVKNVVPQGAIPGKPYHRDD